jgi:hypothetical protein
VIRSFGQASIGYRGERLLYLVPTAASTQPALASYQSGPDPKARAIAFPAGILVLTMAGPRIGAITRFHGDGLYPRFGLSQSLAGPVAQPAR